jgi:hypothetical protein
MVLPLLHMWAIGFLHCVIVATMSTRNTPQPLTEGTHVALDHMSCAAAVFAAPVQDLGPWLVACHVHVEPTELNIYSLLSGKQMVLPLLHMSAIGFLHCVIVATMSARNTPQPLTEGTHVALDQMPCAAAVFAAPEGPWLMACHMHVEQWSRAMRGDFKLGCAT